MYKKFYKNKLEYFSNEIQKLNSSIKVFKQK